MRLNDVEDLCFVGNFLEGGFCHGFCDKNTRQKQIFYSFSRWTASIATHIWYLTAPCGRGKYLIVKSLIKNGFKSNKNIPTNLEKRSNLHSARMNCFVCFGFSAVVLNGNLQTFGNGSLIAGIPCEIFAWFE